MSGKDDKQTDVYHSFQEFCQYIPKLKLPVGWSTNISEFTYTEKIWQYSWSIAVWNYCGLEFSLKIWRFTFFIPPDPDIYTTKNWVQNITLTNLIRVLSSYKLCTGVENEIAKKSSTRYTVPEDIKHCNNSLNKPNIYFRPDLWHVLVKNELKCKICQKYDNFCISKAVKFPRDSQQY